MSSLGGGGGGPGDGDGSRDGGGGRVEGPDSGCSWLRERPPESREILDKDRVGVSTGRSGLALLLFASNKMEDLLPEGSSYSLVGKALWECDELSSRELSGESTFLESSLIC